MSGDIKTHFRSGVPLALGLAAAGLLAACDEAGNFNLRDAFTPKAEEAGEETETATATGEVIERDVEAPEVFSSNEAGLWDGRPSLGGVWVAHPDVTDPERVLIRNQSNGQFVVGALFRRERDIPGPRLQMSSDAAEALGVLAGAPTELEVVALRKETVEVDPPAAAEDATEAPAEITETALDPIAAAGAAIEAAEPTAAESTAASTSAEAVIEPAALPQSTLPQTVAATSSLQKPFIQIGIFSAEANADRAAKQMRSAGLIPTVKAQELGDKPFWRVVVGPATSASEQRRLLATIKDEGFSDAYAVTN
ncbi:SPOR domain-containing protein [Roseobacter sinensis]|uniref:SPOR domain-containing protein n=1 Tax=Roseobacter sinensis TaxID=2931391 RepID=A0ABT3BGR7_9RHOB|nr:SPOR domain-containing protein [Roseobacter sp. WL0113]MCV3272735.1 SPOR domain-containing protein [Roseobacter sp. WL0113]